MDITEIWSPKNKDDKSGFYNRFLKYMNINHECNFEIEETIEEKLEKLETELKNLKIKSKETVDEIMNVNKKLLYENDNLKEKLKKLGEECDEDDIVIKNFRDKYKLRNIELLSSPVFVEPLKYSDKLNNNNNNDNYIC